MLIIDLYSGTGGATQAMKDRGWDVITVDIDERFNPTYAVDVRQFLDVYDGRTPDFIWASPPCIEFSRVEKPWFDDVRPSEESLQLVYAVFRIVRVLRPKFWILENVRGAQHWIGRAPFHVGSVYMWGWFPFNKLKRLVNHRDAMWKWKLPPSKNRSVMRAKIPEIISKAVARVLDEEINSIPVYPLLKRRPS